MTISSIYKPIPTNINVYVRLQLCFVTETTGPGGRCKGELAVWWDLILQSQYRSVNLTNSVASSQIGNILWIREKVQEKLHPLLDVLVFFPVKYSE